MLTFSIENPSELLLEPTALQSKVDELEQSIKTWRGDSADDGFDTRVSQSFEIIRYMRKKDRLPGAHYDFNGRAIGVVQIDPGETPWKIENIVTHPAYYGCGGALIEYCVRLSILNSSGGLKLYAASPEAGEAYSRLGFSYTKAGEGHRRGDMVLNPSTAQQWSPTPANSPSAGDFTNYVLSKHAGKGYAVSLDNGG